MTGYEIKGAAIPERRFLSISDAMRVARRELEKPEIVSITVRKLPDADSPVTIKTEISAKS